jgi:Dolichyl-phosphate-mannose-protein mannosyltransferase
VGGSAAAATTATTEPLPASRVDGRMLGVAAGTLAVAALSVGALLAVRRPLTIDEAAIVDALGGGFRGSLETSLDQAPGETAFRALLYPLAAADAPDWALRAPSLVAVALAAAPVFATGRLLSGRLAGATAAVLMVVGAVASGIAYEARPHALALLCVSLSTLLFVEAMTHDGTAPWLAWALVASFAPLVHPACAAVVVAQLIALAVASQGRPPIALPAAAVVAAVAGLLVAATAIERWHASASSRVDHAVLTAAANTAAWSPIALAAAVAGVVVLVRRREHWQATLVAGLAAGPPIAIALSATVVPVHPARVATLALPGIALATGIAVAAISDLRLVAGAAALIMAASFAAVVTNLVREPEADWPRAADWIARRASADETVVVVPPRARAAYARVANGARLHAVGRGDGVWVVLRTPSDEAIAAARTVVATPRYALLEQRHFGVDLVVEHWVRP